VRKPKNQGGATGGRYVSPHPTVFSRSPQNLKREKSNSSQKDWSNNTINYGDDNAFPLRIAKAVQDSPATAACLKTISQFIKGASFSDKELMKVKVNRHGLTLWDLHSQLSDILPIFEGFAVNFKYSAAYKIKSLYILPFESCRFIKPKDDNDDDIKEILYNPYIGTDQYKREQDAVYNVYNLAAIADEYAAKGNLYKGQVYYYGKTKPLYRFYPVPDYWSAKDWIQIDCKIQGFHANNLENGFFQSVLMTIIGDPNEWTRNPRYQIEKEREDGTKFREGSITVGEEFNKVMSESFSGYNKAGNVMVQWARNLDQAQKIQEFPSSTNAELFTALQDLCTKNITIATGVPSILANISEGVNLGSGGSEIQKAIELMQSRVTEWQTILTQFYNEVLLPNLESFQYTDLRKVEIVNFKPVSEEVKLDGQFWEVLTPEEKRLFIKKNFPNVELLPTPAALPGVAPIPGQPAPGLPSSPEQKVNENLKNLTGRQLQNVQRIVAKFNKGQLTFEQAKQMLMAGFAMTEEDVNVWLVTPEEENGLPIIP
jgi:hypothetical protein